MYDKEDLIDRLQKFDSAYDDTKHLMQEAAERIAELEAEVTVMQHALKAIDDLGCCPVCKRIAAVALNKADTSPRRCPTCDSHQPNLHPAMQFEGEVQPCSDTWHTHPQEGKWEVTNKSGERMERVEGLMNEIIRNPQEEKIIDPPGFE